MEDSGGRGTWACADYSPLNRGEILDRENHRHAAPRKATSRMHCSRCSLCGLRTTLAAKFHSSYKTGGGGHTTPAPSTSLPCCSHQRSQPEQRGSGTKRCLRSTPPSLLPFLFLDPFGCCRSADKQLFPDAQQALCFVFCLCGCRQEVKLFSDACIRAGACRLPDVCSHRVCG